MSNETVEVISFIGPPLELGEMFAKLVGTKYPSSSLGKKEIQPKPQLANLAGRGCASRSQGPLSPPQLQPPLEVHGQAVLSTTTALHVGASGQFPLPPPP